MFEPRPLEHTLKKKAFEQQAQPLRQELLEAQFDLAGRNYPMIILLSGLEGAGKGAFVHRLNEWMDPRLIDTNAFWEHSDEEESRPYYWRFWRRMPRKGSTGLFIGSWYSAPMDAAVAADSPGDLAATCARITQFERMLTDDGVLLVKLFFFVSSETQQLQLKEEAPHNKQIPRVPASATYCEKNYDRILQVAERMIRATDTPTCPWHVVETEDPLYRDLSAATIILRALRTAAKRADDAAPQKPATPPAALPGAESNYLARVDLDQTLARDNYKRALKKWQGRLQDLAWQARGRRRSLVAVFEGWDAAGKGSAIRRVTQAIDPRLFKLVQFAAPTDEESAQHYLWRFWRHLQRDGQATLFDRSWYGRVLVERVEGFASETEWRRAYDEINLFEWQLQEHGCIAVKFWLHISKEEQLLRFKAREVTPHKRHKITPDDWRNRDKWEDYRAAVEDMVRRTSTPHAPWTLVAGDDKRFARIQILKTLCRALEVNLSQDRPVRQSPTGKQVKRADGRQ